MSSSIRVETVTFINQSWLILQHPESFIPKLHFK